MLRRSSCQPLSRLRPLTSTASNWVRCNSTPIGAFLLSRVWLQLVLFTSLIAWPVGEPRSTGAGVVFPADSLTAGWLRWDAEWYYSIASEGYTNLPRNDANQRDTAFFPMYPAAVAILAKITGNIPASGLVLSNVAFLFALVLLYKLALVHYPKDVAGRAVVLLAFSPFSFFFSSMYTESLFLLAVVAAFYFGELRRWGFAGVSASIAAATRLLGFTVVIGLLTLHLEQREFRWRGAGWSILYPLVGLLGLAAFPVFLFLRFGDPLLFIKSQYAVGWAQGVDATLVVSSIRTLSQARSVAEAFYPVLNIIHLIAWTVSAPLAFLAWKRPRIAYSIWSILMVALSLSLWRSAGRFAATVFPLFLVAAFFLRNRVLYHIVLILAALFLALFASLFAHSYWVG